MFCEMEADQESNSRTSSGLRALFIDVIFDMEGDLGR